MIQRIRQARIAVERRAAAGWCATLVLSWLLFAGAAPPALAADEADLAEFSLESLMEVSVVGASRYEQKLTEAPSYVTIVTQNDIRQFGYRNLADVLQSIPGVHISYDRNYNYAGIRGFCPPGDYNTRVLLVVDGHRINNNVYDQALVGNEFPIDIDLVERVEFVRGPGSAIYGSNAFFGIINVITRRGGNLEGAELSASAASHRTFQGRITYGREVYRGPEFLVSGTASDSRGQDLYFPEYDAPPTSNGVAVNADGEEFRSAFAKVYRGDFTLAGATVHRKKNVPTGAWETTFNDSRTFTVDEASYLDLRYERELSGGVDVAARLFWDHTRYRGDYFYDPDLNKDYANGGWWGAELRAKTKFRDRHIVTGGAEYRGNYVQEQGNYYVDPYSPVMYDKRRSTVWSAFLQTEIRVLPNLIVNAGVRYDDYETFGGNTSPRAGLIWFPRQTTTAKFLYGNAFRVPNVYELYYSDGVSMNPNPALQPETIDTYEAILEQFFELFGIRWKGTVAGYHYRIKNLITAQPDPSDPAFSIFVNSSSIKANGLELELDGRTAGGLGGRASYTVQRAKLDPTGDSLVNSPRSSAKLALSLPLRGNKATLNPEIRYLSGRKTVPGKAAESVGGYTLVNVTLFTREILKGLDLSASAYNVLDRDYADPAGGEFLQDAIPQDGRSYRVKATYSF